MRNRRSDGQETSQRLLAVACRIFAAKGFREATVAEICRAAKANMAAVNYHFGSKERLYVESWRHAFKASLRAHPPDGGVPPDAPPEERLRGRIRSLMRRIIDPESFSFDILHKEMANPTGLLVGAVQESMEPIRLDFTALIRELLGEASEQQVRLCFMSIKAQCFGPLLRERRRQISFRGRQSFGSEPLAEDVETLADHVTGFSLAGIREIKRLNGRSRAAEARGSRP